MVGAVATVNDTKAAVAGGALTVKGTPVTVAAEADACRFSEIETGELAMYTGGIGVGELTTPLGSPDKVIVVNPRNPPAGVSVTVSGEVAPLASNDIVDADDDIVSAPAGKGVGSISKYAPVAVAVAVVLITSRRSTFVESAERLVSKIVNGIIPHHEAVKNVYAGQ